MANVVNYPNDDTVITLRGVPINLASDIGRAFTCDACRNAEKLMTDIELQDKYGLTSEDLEQLSQNKTLARAIQDERLSRVRTGLAAMESAAKEFAGAPKILGDILRDTGASPRHRIESARELRQTALGTGPENAKADTSERFHITINLGADTEKIVIDQPRRPITPENDGKANADASGA
jgi:hypothetical protein